MCDTKCKEMKWNFLNSIIDCSLSLSVKSMDFHIVILQIRTYDNKLVLKQLYYTYIQMRSFNIRLRQVLEL